MPKVLFYVNDAWPVQAGYTIRTHYIASNLRKMGYEVSVCNQLNRSTDILKAMGLAVQPYMEKDGVAYHTFHNDLLLDCWTYGFFMKLGEYGVRGAKRIGNKIALPVYTNWIDVTSGKPDVVHAHTPPAIANQALSLARHFCAPTIYEVRGFWPLSRAAKNGDPVNVTKVVSRDVKAAKRAQHVVAICKGIADQLVRGGIRPSKISIIPNGVDTSLFHPKVRDRDLAKKLGVEDRIVYGYASSIRRLEGIQTMIKAWPRIVRRIPGAIFLLLGDGSYLSKLKVLARENGVEETFLFLGRVPHEEMVSYYSIFDVFVVPRIPEPVCEIVTPLKPFEAMAMGVPVIASDVSALREIVRDGETGTLFRAGDPDALAECCIQMGGDAGLRDKLSLQARDWVTKERDWAVVTSKYQEVYDSIYH